MEQPIRARVPEHVSLGAFSTGVIVMTANSEFILDFVQNLGRPHQITARVVMPHYVLPQLVDALQRNIELYRSRWGDLPQGGMAAPAQLPWSSNSAAPSVANPPNATAGSTEAQAAPGGSAAPAPSSSNSGASDSGYPGADDASQERASDSRAGQTQQDIGVRHPTAQDIYDDLKIRDELLSGAYANAVMIGHGPHEFSFDFITNFYPHSSVSARVFMAAGQVPRLYESLKGTWDQLRARKQQRGNNPGGSNPGQDPPDVGPDSGSPGGDYPIV